MGATFLLNMLILAIAAVVVFLIAKYILNEAEADPVIRKIVLLILLILFLIALANAVSGGAIFGHPIVVN